VFLVSMTAAAAHPIMPSADLVHSRFAMGRTAHCDVHYDPGRYDVVESAERVSVRRKAVPDGEVLRLDLRTGECALRKPLLLGLPVYHCLRGPAFFASTHVRLLRTLAFRSRRIAVRCRSSFYTVT